MVVVVANMVAEALECAVIRLKGARRPSHRHTVLNLDVIPWYILELMHTLPAYRIIQFLI